MSEHGVALPVIRAMHAHLAGGGLSLPDMADIAHLSPFHFIRAFRDDTGLPPGAFQAALRLVEAKRLMRETDAPVTDVCFELGYASLGTFVTRFTAAVGLTPMQYRQICRAAVAASAPEVARPDGGGAAPLGVTGQVHADRQPAGPIFIGLFRRILPSGLPQAGTAVWGAGPFALAPVADGTYALLAAACPADGAALREALARDEALWVGIASPVEVRGGRSEPVAVALRPRADVDPPVLLALPLLMARAVERWDGWRRLRDTPAGG